MKVRLLVPALALAAVALAGCGGAPTPAPSSLTSAKGADDAATFLACLTSSGVEARINDSGQVLVKVPTEGTAGKQGLHEISSESGGEGLLGMEGDDAGNTWVAAAKATAFADADTQDAYAACEKRHPGFVQPPFDPNTDPAHKEMLAEQEKQALAFAQCARTNGFPQIADPDFSKMSGVLLPEDMTEDEFRELLKACWDPKSNLSFGTSADAPFEPWRVMDELATEAGS
ncbi:MAG: hypothetical protein IPJ61_04975 [Tessaracoccus sp.]|uniref:hypothetical protein n=1 Tax=Tessaracoccus sp. TaxID=1971211 RepID=UPI001EB0E873|nr:hypothetical protein [Tessaracoccus sp.]MBK7820428.1 hypothetical protein [Tessaracoccus sp.]